MNEISSPLASVASGVGVPLDRLIARIAAGRMVMLVDDVTRGGEGALVMPADAVDDQSITFMALEARGIICLAITAEHAFRLGLQLQPRRGDHRLDTSFTMSIEARRGVTTGISAADRAATIAAAMKSSADEVTINSPGHVFPVVAAVGGVLERPGYAEAAIELMIRAERPPAAAFCRILREDGRMADAAALLALARDHGLAVGRISDVVASCAGIGTLRRPSDVGRTTARCTPSAPSEAAVSASAPATGSNADPARGLKLAMRRLAATVAVITASHEGRRGGMTATAVCSLSMDPPSIVACVNRSANTHDLITGSGRFCVNLLTETQREIAETFAGRGGQDGAEKFLACGAWDESEFGIPLLRDGLAAIICDLGQGLEVKTHSVLTGIVRHVTCAESARPLIYSDQGFTTILGGKLSVG